MSEIKLEYLSAAAIAQQLKKKRKLAAVETMVRSFKKLEQIEDTEDELKDKAFKNEVVYLQRYFIPSPYFEFLLKELSSTFFFTREDASVVFAKIVPSVSKERGEGAGGGQRRTG